MVNGVFIAVPVSYHRASLLELEITPYISSGLRPVLLENLHITIAYLGTVKEQQLTTLKGELSTLAAYLPTKLEVTQIRNFPAPNSSLIAGIVAGCFELQQLYEKTVNLLEQLSISADLKTGFKPHITLGRVAKSSTLNLDIPLDPGISISPDMIGLYHGVQTNGIYRYQPLFSIDRNAGSSSS